VQLIIGPPVVELLLNTPTHLELQIGRKGHVAGIKQAVAKKAD
jgi:hypothetical protein